MKGKMKKERKIVRERLYGKHLCQCFPAQLRGRKIVEILYIRRPFSYIILQKKNNIWQKRSLYEVDVLFKKYSKFGKSLSCPGYVSTLRKLCINHINDVISNLTILLKYCFLGTDIEA